MTTVMDSAVNTFSPATIQHRRSVSLLGATGSVGRSTLDIISQHPEYFDIVALTAYDKVDDLARLAHKFRPQMVAIGNEGEYSRLKELLGGSDIKIAAGTEALEEAASVPADVVMAAIVGAAGLKPTLAAIKSGANVALANKESLVCAGGLVTRMADKYGATLIPVDSEHNAVFQVFDFEHPETIDSITLTASGGPFRGYSYEDLQRVTPGQAIAHPNWNMGAKISVDSATMMNKALEVIEAYHLFPLSAEQIKVVIHPESIIHSMVTYIDGSTLAQMGNPDMTIPIASALAWPKRIGNSTPAPLNLATLGKLSFCEANGELFPALRLAYEVLNSNSNATAVIFNAANEIAVARFLSNDIAFTSIITIVEKALDSMYNSCEQECTDIDGIIELDHEARIFAGECKI